MYHVFDRWKLAWKSHQKICLKEPFFVPKNVFPQNFSVIYGKAKNRCSFVICRDWRCLEAPTEAMWFVMWRWREVGLDVGRLIKNCALIRLAFVFFCTQISNLPRLPFVQLIFQPPNLFKTVTRKKNTSDGWDEWWRPKERRTSGQTRNLLHSMNLISSSKQPQYQPKIHHQTTNGNHRQRYLSSSFTGWLVLKWWKWN